jgi:pyruvate/2-oxoglutarate dehydrogenase complex dihydrolipoamide acyltransferase (E2) component
MKREKTTDLRKLSIYGFELATGGHNFFALLDIDITNLRTFLRRERREGNGGSLFSLVLKAIGICLQEFPEFNSMIDLKHTTTFEQVDISIPIEIEDDGKSITKQCIVRDITHKTITDIDNEINNAKTSKNEDKGYVPSPIIRKILTSLPLPLVRFIFTRILHNHRLVQELSGTIFVTSVSMFSKVPGYIIPYIGGPKAVSLALGSIAKKPIVVQDEIRIREMYSITVIFNHDVIDGAPAARFINRFRNLLEKSYAELI